MLKAYDTTFVGMCTKKIATLCNFFWVSRPAIVFFSACVPKNNYTKQQQLHNMAICFVHTLTEKKSHSMVFFLYT